MRLISVNNRAINCKQKSLFNFYDDLSESLGSAHGVAVVSNHEVLDDIHFVDVAVGVFLSNCKR